MAVINPIFIVLLISFIATIMLAIVIDRKIPKSQLRNSFVSIVLCLLICDTGLLLQILLADKLRY